MKTLKIYGASDDLIEIEGDLRDEVYYKEDELNCIACSDGTVLSIAYVDGGFWRINRLAAGTASYEKFEAVDADSPEYSDVVTLTGDIQWVCVGEFKKVK